jgi:hypothetical protein
MITSVRRGEQETVNTHNNVIDKQLTHYYDGIV